MNQQEGTAMLPGNSEVTITGNQWIPGGKKIKDFFEMQNATGSAICPVRDIISRISDKWSILTILALGGYGTMRFNALKGRIDGISQRMLTITLRNLEGDGIITREIFQEMPPRVEYRLSGLGFSLLHQFCLFTDWAQDHAEEIHHARKTGGNQVFKNNVRQAKI